MAPWSYEHRNLSMSIARRLVQAAMAGDTLGVATMLHSNADIGTDELTVPTVAQLNALVSKVTPLAAAAYNGHCSTLRVIMLDARCMTKYAFETAVFMAIINDQEQTLRQLVACPRFSLNKYRVGLNGSPMTPLTLAVFCGTPAMVYTLLTTDESRVGGKVNTAALSGLIGMTAMEIAIFKSENLKKVQMLAAEGTSPLTTRLAVRVPASIDGWLQSIIDRCVLPVTIAVGFGWWRMTQQHVQRLWKSPTGDVRSLLQSTRLYSAKTNTAARLAHNVVAGNVIQLYPLYSKNTRYAIYQLMMVLLNRPVVALPIELCEYIVHFVQVCWFQKQ